MQKDIFSKSEHVYGVRADHSSLDSCNVDFQVPPPEQGGKIPTLNQKGYMIVDDDKILQAFVENSEHCKKPVLDIGTAYGAASMRALEKGATVIANDVDERHLLLLRQTAPKDHWHRLYLNKSYFPTEINLPDNCLDAVLLRHIVHFLTPDEIEASFAKISKWLVKGGRVYILVMSPYHHYFTGFSEIYENRWQKGDPWPGLIPNLKDYIPDQASKVPDFLHVMDHRPLQKLLEKINFATEEVILFDYENYPKPDTVGLPGFYGVIASKIN